MWQWLDVILVTLIVVLCAAYALYALGSIGLKRHLLSLLVRCFGLRVLSILSPRLGGCDNCSAGSRGSDFLRKTKR